MRKKRVPRRSLSHPFVYAVLLGVFLVAAPAYAGFAPIVVSPATLPNGTVGVAYFQKVSMSDGGSNYEVKYLEWNGTVASTPEHVDTVQLEYGLSLAIDSNGRPASWRRRRGGF